MLLNRLTERAALGQLLEAGRSGALVVHGEAGVGKTALVEDAVASAADMRIARVAGIESEMELAYAALQQLCARMLDGLDRLADPQREALAVVFGLRAGEAPDRFLVSLAASMPVIRFWVMLASRRTKSTTTGASQGSSSPRLRTESAGHTSVRVDSRDLVVGSVLIAGHAGTAARGADLPGNQPRGGTSGAAPWAGSARASWLREPMPSLVKTFRRW